MRVLTESNGYYNHSDQHMLFQGHRLTMGLTAKKVERILLLLAAISVLYCFRNRLGRCAMIGGARKDEAGGDDASETGGDEEDVQVGSGGIDPRGCWAAGGGSSS